MQIQQYLDGIDYPANKQSLIEYAKSKGAPQEVFNALSGIQDRQFNGPADIMKAMGNIL